MSYPKSLEEAFWRKCVPAQEGCWIWRGRPRDTGYGRVTACGATFYAHRVSFELAFGPIPAGLTVDHTCHSSDPICPGGPSCPHRLCVRPDHLEVVTSAVNASRAGFVLRTGHCTKGHQVSSENVYVVRGLRTCRHCHLDRQAKYNAEHQDEINEKARSRRAVHKDAVRGAFDMAPGHG